ncbi:MAG: DHHA1 domain-containing protein [Candidatus Baldrarchaeia archaeon]
MLVTRVDIPKKSMEAVAKKAVQKYPNLVVLIGRVNGGAAIIGTAGEKAIDKGINIGDIVNKVSKILGGGGGGQLNFAKGGGPRGDMLEEALENGKKLILEKIS